MPYHIITLYNTGSDIHTCVYTHKHVQRGTTQDLEGVLDTVMGPHVKWAGEPNNNNNNNRSIWGSVPAEKGHRGPQYVCVWEG